MTTDNRVDYHIKDTTGYFITTHPHPVAVNVPRIVHEEPNMGPTFGGPCEIFQVFRQRNFEQRDTDNSNNKSLRLGDPSII